LDNFSSRFFPLCHAKHVDIAKLSNCQNESRFAGVAGLRNWLRIALHPGLPGRAIGYTDDDERRHASDSPRGMSMRSACSRHKRGVGKALHAVKHRLRFADVTGCQQQENAECA